MPSLEVKVPLPCLLPLKMNLRKSNRLASGILLFRFVDHPHNPRHKFLHLPTRIYPDHVFVLDGIRRCNTIHLSIERNLFHVSPSCCSVLPRKNHQKSQSIQFLQTCIRKETTMKKSKKCFKYFRHADYSK